MTRLVYPLKCDAIRSFNAEIYTFYSCSGVQGSVEYVGYLLQLLFDSSRVIVNFCSVDVFQQRQIFSHVNNSITNIGSNY